MNPFDSLVEREQESGRQARLPGVAFAEVVRITDEGYILRYLSLNLDDDSAPARAATMMAGGRRGSFLMPEVGDEVVVGFENGSIDRPVILGALWSDVDPPPDQADTSESNNVRTIVSRAGHEVTMDDTQGRGKVTVRSATGHQVELNDAAGQSGVTVRTSAGVTVQLSNTPPKVMVQAATIELVGNVTIAGNLSFGGAGGAPSAELTLPGTVNLTNSPTINGQQLTLNLPAGFNVITGGTAATSLIRLDTVSWNHQHPVAMSPVPLAQAPPVTGS